MSEEQKKQIRDYIRYLMGQSQLRHMVFCLTFAKARDVCPDVTVKELYEYVKHCYEGE